MLALVCASVVLAMSTWFATSAVQSQLLEHYLQTTATPGAPAAQQGAMLVVAVQLGFMSAAIASVVLQLADRVSPTTLMGCGGVCAALSTALLLVLPYRPAVGCRFLTGCALALVYPAASGSGSGPWYTPRRLVVGPGLTRRRDSHTTTPWPPQSVGSIRPLYTASGDGAAQAVLRRPPRGQWRCGFTFRCVSTPHRCCHEARVWLAMDGAVAPLPTLNHSTARTRTHTHTHTHRPTDRFTCPFH